MNRIFEGSRVSRVAYRSAIKGALDALYKRKAEVERLIRCLESSSSCRKRALQHKHRILAEKTPEWRDVEQNCRQGRQLDSSPHAHT